jgi:hypothetical protein
VQKGGLARRDEAKTPVGFSDFLSAMNQASSKWFHGSYYRDTSDVRPIAFEDGNVSWASQSYPNDAV